MGKFLSPPSPIAYKTKCAIILYPADDGAFFLSALRGQLSELGRGYIWEGDREKTSEIAQIWRNHDLMTDRVFFSIDCEDVPFITGDETLNVNVNVNCCCNSGSTDSLVCFDSNGNPIINPGPYIPDQNNPVGDDWPIVPYEDNLPVGFDDWTEYDNNACSASNALYELLVLIIVSAYGIVDLGEKLAYVLITFAGLFPAAVASALGNAFLLRAVEALLAGAKAADDLKDWITEALKYVRENQQEIVCTIFTNRYNVPGIKTNLRAKIVSWVAGVFTLDTGDTAIFYNVIDAILPLTVFFDWLVKAEAYIDLTVNPIDCSLCGSSFTWEHNTGNGDGTLEITQQGDDFVWMSGLIPTTGSTQVQGFNGPTNGMQAVGTPASAQALSFFAHEVSHEFGTGLGESSVSFNILDYNVAGQFNGNIYNKSILAKLPGYSGPTIGYDHVLSITQSEGFMRLPAFGNTSPGEAFLSIIRVATGQAQFNIAINISSLRLLDSSGNQLEVEEIP